MSQAPAPASAPAGRIDSPFWAGLADGILRIQRCAACARWTWPPQWRCGECGGWEMEWPQVPMEGTIHSLSWTRHPFSPRMVGRVPYPVLLVELPGAGGARLLGLLDGPADGLAIGAPVTGFPEETAGRTALRWRIARGAGR